MLRLRGGSLGIVGGSVLLGGRVRCDEPPFLCDSSALETPAAPPEQDSGGRASESDGILAAAFSSSGEYFAMTDERKRLVLFRTRPTWERLSVRGVSRRCTALTFTPNDSHLLAADKSGDVFSFSITEPQNPGELELGHLSMLLDLVVSRDGRHIISCDRDEKIRVSLWEAPHVIAAFCLGHTEFVSQLLVLPGPDNLLLSGSGDGTLRLWRYESGREIQRCDLGDVPQPGDEAEGKRLAVSRLSCSPGGEHVAALCDGVAGVFLLPVVAGPALAAPQFVRLPAVPLDVDFEDAGTLWVLSGVRETPIQVYRHSDSGWTVSPLEPDVQRLSDSIQEHWQQLAGSVSRGDRFSVLYKAVFDNMASYLMKKEARIQSEKRKLPSSNQANSTAKTQKT